ncbi:MAG: type I 3-dehydroquinate dehydratase [Candidatus Aminicenantales bacterium]
MICVSLGNISFDECRRLLFRVEMAELRLDLLDFSLAQVRTIFSFHPNLVATFRSGKSTNKKRKTFLLEAITAGARYIDLDIRTDAKLVSELKASMKRTDCELIISYHNFRKTPEDAKLRQIVDEAFFRGADIAKVACFCRQPKDNARLLGLLSDGRRVIVSGMGPLGSITRVAAGLCGSGFTYASWEGMTPTAPDQLSYQRIKKIYKLLESNRQRTKGPVHQENSGKTKMKPAMAKRVSG